MENDSIYSKERRNYMRKKCSTMPDKIRAKTYLTQVYLNENVKHKRNLKDKVMIDKTYAYVPEVWDVSYKEMKETLQVIKERIEDKKKRDAEQNKLFE